MVVLCPSGKTNRTSKKLFWWWWLPGFVPTSHFWRGSCWWNWHWEAFTGVFWVLWLCQGLGYITDLSDCIFHLLKWETSACQMRCLGWNILDGILVVMGSVETIIGSEVCQLLNVFKNKLTFYKYKFSWEMWVCCQMKFCLLKLEIFCENVNWREQTGYITSVERTCSTSLFTEYFFVILTNF